MKKHFLIAAAISGMLLALPNFNVQAEPGRGRSDEYYRDYRRHDDYRYERDRRHRFEWERRRREEERRRREYEWRRHHRHHHDGDHYRRY